MTDPTADGPVNLHASAAVLGEAGVLVRGPSGSGKTRLALALVETVRCRDGFARLVADDRTLVSVHGGRLVARPHPRLAGYVERRGLGIVAVDHEPACVIRLVADLAPGMPHRLPEPSEREIMIAGVVIRRLALATTTSTPDAVALVLAVLDGEGATL